MIKPILIWPNPGLTVKSFAVESEEFGTPEFDALITDLWDTLYDSGGVGLSAIQIGVPKRVFVMDTGNKNGLCWVFCNPVLIDHQGVIGKVNEGCLSLPGIIESVPRWPKVTVDAFDEKGVPFKSVHTNLDGQCVQHETDHLDGITIPDRLSPMERAHVAKKMAARAKGGE